MDCGILTDDSNDDGSENGNENGDANGCCEDSHPFRTSTRSAFA